MRNLSLVILLFAAELSLCAQTFYSSTGAVDTTLLELPALKANDVVIFHKGYTVSYNPATLIPNWVAYNLTADELEGDATRQAKFTQDPSYPGPQGRTTDYSRSGYDRGHMAPAADMKWDMDAMKESFYLTNVCPQTPSLNRRYWLALEDFVRDMAGQYGNVWVVCGPVLGQDNAHIGADGITVPAACFKALVAFNGERFIGAGFLMPNDEQAHPIDYSIMSIDDLEEIVGYNLFCHLDEYEQGAESSASLID